MLQKSSTLNIISDVEAERTNNTGENVPRKLPTNCLELSDLTLQQQKGWTPNGGKEPFSLLWLDFSFEMSMQCYCHCWGFDCLLNGPIQDCTILQYNSRSPCFFIVSWNILSSIMSAETHRQMPMLLDTWHSVDIYWDLHILMNILEHSI